MNIQQDEIFNQLIHTYLFYGLLMSKNIFFNKYWFNIKFKNKFNLNELSIHNSKYYHIKEFKHLILNDRSENKFRILVEQVFFSRIWILRYQKWLIINFYALQSANKLKIKKIAKFSKSGIFIKNFHFSKFKSNFIKFKKYKLLLFLIFTHIKPIIQKNYIF